jgi:hypothetical protein
LPSVADHDCEVPTCRILIVEDAAGDADLLLRAVLGRHRDDRDLARWIDVGPALELDRRPRLDVELES